MDGESRTATQIPFSDHTNPGLPGARPSDDPEVGDALIIVGYETGASDGTTALPRITRLGEALLGGSRPWRIRRLAAPGSDRDVPTRRNVRREIDALFARRAAARLLIITGEVTRTLEGLALVCAPDLAGFREDATVALEWIGDRLRPTPIATVVVLAAHAEQRDPQRWLGALASTPSDHLVVTHGGDPVEALEVLVDGMSEDHPQGLESVTPSSLGAYVERRLVGAAIRRSRSTTPLVARAAVRIAAVPGEPVQTADPEDLVGTMLPGRFRIDAEIARGGFSIVYRAYQELFERDVAIKVLQANLTPEAARMFLAEIRTVARLEHHNIVRVFHADLTHGGRLFLAMELLAGRTLQQLLDEVGALPPPRAVAIARQLLAGLATAHARGVVHADVKPANILVLDGQEERVVLLDFGLSRFQASPAVASLGGTPAFMAPEQLRDGVVDARSDLYATGLVLLAMLAGGRPESPAALAAAVDEIPDQHVRGAVRRALAEDPAQRFASAAEMAAALSAGEVSVAPPRPPFRIAAPLSEEDRADFFGRDREIEILLEHVLFRRAAIYVAPSGTGKTSLLRAGLLPRLDQLGVRGVYVACRSGVPEGIAAAIDPDASSVADAIRRHHEVSQRRLVIVIDQIEAALLVASHVDTVVEALEVPRWPTDAQVSIVLSVREEYLARLLDRTQRLDPGIPIVRLGPLSPERAREVLVRTLAARSITIEGALLDALIEDLARAASKLAIELSWGGGPAIYAPHLQLAGAVLYEALPAGDTELLLSLYRQLGGLDKIVAEHLHHVLEGELSPEDTAIVRDLLLALVTGSHTRAARSESELLAIARRPSRAQPDGSRADRPRDAILAVISFLRDRGLLVGAPGPADEPLWDLAHDSLIQRVQEWITSTDLARRRALELVRYHLRRSRAGSVSLLGGDELREIRQHLGPTDLTELDEEWALPGQSSPATRIVASSRGAIRRRRAIAAGIAVTAVATVVALASRWQKERELRQRETSLRDRDIGQFELELRAFDWDPASLAARDVAAPSGLALDWELRKPDPDDEDSPGPEFAADDLQRRTLSTGSAGRLDAVSARGGPAVLIVRRRDPREPEPFCEDVVVPIRRLPGYSKDAAAPRFVVRVPSCAATRAGMVEIPAGRFIAGGQGDPPTPYRDSELPPESIVDLPRYWIDRTEVSIAALEVFLSMRPLHGIAAPPRPANFDRYPDAPRYPAAAMTWREARAFCRYLGKDLPTMDEWDKALRGGVTIEDRDNPCPRRNFAWCGPMNTAWTNVRIGAGEQARPTPVGSRPHDASPYGVLDLVGNVHEWTRSPDLPYETFPATLSASERRRRQTEARSIVITRGCNWGDVECADNPLVIMPIPNPRLRDVRYFTLGMRCSVSGSD